MTLSANDDRTDQPGKHITPDPRHNKVTSPLAFFHILPTIDHNASGPVFRLDLESHRIVRRNTGNHLASAASDTRSAHQSATRVPIVLGAKARTVRSHGHAGCVQGDRSVVAFF